MCVCVCACVRARVCACVILPSQPKSTTCFVHCWDYCVQIYRTQFVVKHFAGDIRYETDQCVAAQTMPNVFLHRSLLPLCPHFPFSSPLLSLSLWFLATCLLTRTWPLIPCRFLEKNRDPFPEDVREMLCESESTFISSLFNVRLPSSLCCRILFSPCLFSRPLLLLAPLSVKQHLLAHFLHSLPFLVPHLCAPLPSERIPSQCNCWCRSVVYDAAAPQLTASTNGAKWQCAQVWNNAPVMCFKTFRFCISVSLYLCLLLCVLRQCCDTLVPCDTDKNQRRQQQVWVRQAAATAYWQQRQTQHACSKLQGVAGTPHAKGTHTRAHNNTVLSMHGRLVCTF